MVLPFIAWAGIAGAGALGLGGYQLGRQVGKATPYIAGSLIVYALLTKGGK